MDPTPPGWREARRFRAFELKQDGWKQIDIAEALGVSEGAVSQWMKKALRGARKRSKLPHGPAVRQNSPRRSVLKGFLSFLRRGRSTSDFEARSGRESAFGRSSRRSSEPKYNVSQVGRILGSDRVEPPKTRPPVRQARRKGDRGVERGEVAANQKKPRLTIEP